MDAIVNVREVFKLLLKSRLSSTLSHAGPPIAGKIRSESSTWWRRSSGVGPTSPRCGTWRRVFGRFVLREEVAPRQPPDMPSALAYGRHGHSRSRLSVVVCSFRMHTVAGMKQMLQCDNGGAPRNRWDSSDSTCVASARRRGSVRTEPRFARVGRRAQQHGVHVAVLFIPQKGAGTDHDVAVETAIDAEDGAVVAL